VRPVQPQDVSAFVTGMKHCWQGVCSHGTEKQKADARRKGFNSSLKQAAGRELIVTRELGGTQFIWLAKLGDTGDA
jgi:hypothetical protein